MQHPVTVESYLRQVEKPYSEYRDGLLYPKSHSTKFHSTVQRNLTALLHRHGGNAFPELTLRISATKYLIPDLVVAGDFPGPYPTEAVKLCCEILSPEDRLGTTLAKCEEYHAWGVPYCWVIDPVKRNAWEYHSGAEPTRFHDALTAGEISVRIHDLFSELD